MFCQDTPLACFFRKTLHQRGIKCCHCFTENIATTLDLKPISTWGCCNRETSVTAVIWGSSLFNTAVLVRNLRTVQGRRETHCLAWWIWMLLKNGKTQDVMMRQFSKHGKCIPVARISCFHPVLTNGLDLSPTDAIKFASHFVASFSLFPFLEKK